MSVVRKCDRCGITVPVECPSGWGRLDVNEGLDKAMLLHLSREVCSDCLKLVVDVLNSKAKTVTMT